MCPAFIKRHSFISSPLPQFFGSYPEPIKTNLQFNILCVSVCSESREEQIALDMNAV